MKIRTLILALVFIAGISLSALYLYREYFKAQPVGATQANIAIDDLYNADQEAAQALAQLQKSQEKATIVTGDKSGSRHIALTFDGLTDRAIIQQILGVLKKYNAKATFFVDGLHTVEDPQTLSDIKDAGQKIENYTLVGLPKMETLPIERLAKDFSRAQKIIKENAGQEPSLLKCNDTKYTDQVLQVAKACGFKGVVQSDTVFNVRQVDTSPEAMDAAVAALRPGSIVSVKLLANVEPVTNEPGKTDQKPAIDKQPGLKEAQPDGVREAEIALTVEKLLIALQKAKYNTVYVEDFAKVNSQTALRSAGGDTLSLPIRITSFLQAQIRALFSFPTAYAAENVQQPASEIKTVFTTEQALSYTFGGLTKETVVNDVLERLNKLGIKATFFISEAEMKKYPQTVRKIIANNHEIGIAIRPKDGESLDETRSNLTRSLTFLKAQFGVSTDLVKQVSGAVTDTTREAVGSLDCKLIGQSINIVQTKHKDYTSVDAIMGEVFKKSMVSLSRGQILYFRMDFYTDDQIVGGLLESVKLNKIDNIGYATFYDNPSNNSSNNSQYTLKSVGAILGNSRYTYQYPVNLQNVPTHLRHDGPEIALDNHNFLAEASKHYIGHESVNHEDRMIEFSKMEERRLDKTGVIHTDEKVIFLSFDDWGSDAAINKLLYVLRKHNVPGTFFVITNNVLYNTNLLRSIAMEGHEIGSHSDKHKPMAVMDSQAHKYVKTQDKEEYLKDLSTSYQKLREVTGDVIVNGRPALTRLFRPPTLAVSKTGMEALLETGYDYIVSGTVSTNDYRAADVSQVVETIKKGIFSEDGEVKKGAILVMHMSDNAKYTATALDILLTANEAKPDSDPSKFKVGRLSDYLFDGYSQINRKKTLRLLHGLDKAPK